MSILQGRTRLSVLFLGLVSGCLAESEDRGAADASAGISPAGDASDSPMDGSGGPGGSPAGESDGSFLPDDAAAGGRPVGDAGPTAPDGRVVTDAVLVPDAMLAPDGRVETDAAPAPDAAAPPDSPPQLAAFRIALTWRTPADEDESDEVGNDLDLHLLRPEGLGWGVTPGDTYYANPQPDWGLPGEPADDPVLVLDDINGAGPELIEFESLAPTAGFPRPYLVGVVYYRVDSLETGAAYGPASLRIVVTARDGTPLWDSDTEFDGGLRLERAQSLAVPLAIAVEEGVPSFISLGHVFEPDGNSVEQPGEVPLGADCDDVGAYRCPEAQACMLAPGRSAGSCVDALGDVELGGACGLEGRLPRCVIGLACRPEPDALFGVCERSVGEGEACGPALCAPGLSCVGAEGLCRATLADGEVCQPAASACAAGVECIDPDEDGTFACGVAVCFETLAALQPCGLEGFFGERERFLTLCRERLSTARQATEAWLDCLLQTATAAAGDAYACFETLLCPQG